MVKQLNSAERVDPAAKFFSDYLPAGSFHARRCHSRPLRFADATATGPSAKVNWSGTLNVKISHRPHSHRDFSGLSDACITWSDL